jgi:membrane-bound metal-dependent hydrolase YbcI (DUF457 family)
MALAYLLSKPSARLLKVNLSVPLIMVLSIIPDIDILLLPTLHRGPTHSIISAIVVFIPVFVFYRRQAVPYFIALISHGLIGDFFIGGQLLLFWPVTAQQFGLHELGSMYIGIESPLNVTIELTLLLAATFVLLGTKDILQFFEARKSNLMLLIPVFTVLLPTFVGYPFEAPLLETLPAEAVGHVFFIVIFAVSVFIALGGVVKRSRVAVG